MIINSVQSSASELLASITILVMMLWILALIVKRITRTHDIKLTFTVTKHSEKNDEEKRV